jgi:HAE1 family hydrophobic/amphiphilic exporter-1/multidrug efflux pump
MGTGVFGGMVFATFIAPAFIPLFFVLLSRKLKHRLHRGDESFRPPHGDPAAEKETP